MLGNDNTDTVCHTTAQRKEQKIQGTGGTHCCKCISTYHLPYDHGVNHVIQLLKNISYNHRKHK